MPQIFHRSFNTISRVTIFGALFVLLGLFWFGTRMARSAYMTNANVVVDQPVKFSHQHHVGVLKIDCRYCHGSVEESSFAGMPSTKTCMNCHNPAQVWGSSPLLEPVRESYRTRRPIAWNRVHNLADFVYFNHSIHVQKGIGCATCHGRVDQMPLTWQVHSLHMEWCLDCHRRPELYVRPRSEVFNMSYVPAEDQRTLGPRLVKEYGIRRLLNCSTCHR